MVKQAEKIRKRSPLQPVIGLLLAIGLFIIAYLLVEPLAQLITSVFPASGFRASLGTPIYFNFTGAKPIIPSGARLGMAFGIWLVLLAIAYTVVAVASGKDPNSAKNIKLPPRTKEERDKRY